MRKLITLVLVGLGPTLAVAGFAAVTTLSPQAALACYVCGSGNHGDCYCTCMGDYC